MTTDKKDTIKGRMSRAARREVIVVTVEVQLCETVELKFAGNLPSADQVRKQAIVAVKNRLTLGETAFQAHIRDIDGEPA